MASDPSSKRAATHRHPMRIVTRRTGLSAEILRLWERRYRVVTPARTQTGRRLYSDAEIERLHLLQRATMGGRGIGLVAALPTPALADLVRQDAEAERAGARRRREDPQVQDRAEAALRESLSAVERFDPVALGASLHRSAIALSAIDFLERVVAPLLDEVGIQCRDGTLPAVHGPLAAAVTRRMLERVSEAPAPDSPRLLVATLMGQTSELGALIASTAAAAHGWAVTWLDGNLSITDIGEAAIKLRAKAVGLTLVRPATDPAMSDELRRLRAILPRRVSLIVGDSAGGSRAVVLDEIRAARFTNLEEFVTVLERFVARKRPASAMEAAPRDTPSTTRARRRS